MTEVADILIIGSGACGAAAAWSLSRDPSLKIVCLEQGDFTKPSTYPSSDSAWELKKFGEFNISPNVRNTSADYPIDTSDSPIAIANYNAVGGSTILYSAHFPRFHPSDFKVKSLDGVGEDWPIDYSDLDPYFIENENMMGVAGVLGDPSYPPMQPMLPPVAMGQMGSALARGFNKLGWHWWPSYGAINTLKGGARPECINLGPCNTGCNQQAKASVDVTYWPVAFRNGVKILTKCRVREITLDRSGLADGVIYLDADGTEHSYKAKVVIVACSGIGTPRLLLNSKSTAFPDGLLNEQGLVGKNLMLHPLAYVEGVFEENVKSNLGPQGCCILSQEFYETDVSRGFVRGYTMQILRGSAPIETAVSGFFMRQIPIGRDHHKKFQKMYNHNAGILIISEDLPELHNRVELDLDKTDSSGVPGVKVHYKLSENTKKMLLHGLGKGKAVLEAANARVTASFAPVKNTGWHLMGTAKMGADAATSVVNKYGQAHHVKNLFIVDSSIFVTSAGLNPVATAQALTLFICDYLKRNLRQLLERP